MILDLDQFKRQLFYWYCIEGLSMAQVKRSFDRLFEELAHVTGIRLEVT